MAAYLDGIIVFDSNPIEHVQTIRSLFKRLRKANLRFSPSKARLGATDANFLGHFISPAGLRRNEEKVSALVNMPMPTDVKQVRALMGRINYYRNFFPTCPRGSVRSTRFSARGLSFCSRPPWKNWCEKSSRSLRPRRFWFSPIKTLSPTAHARSTCTVTLASTGLAPPSNRSRPMAP